MAKVGEVDPKEAYTILADDPETRLVDVRTRAEWAFVGLPDLTGLGKQVWPVEWASFPAMAQNPAFIEEVEALAERDGGAMPKRLLFICRSGARSMAAAQAVAAAHAGSGAPLECLNVAEGFEGDLDAEGHRGRVNGWKVRGLPWRQN